MYISRRHHGHSPPPRRILRGVHRRTALLLGAVSSLFVTLIAWPLLGSEPQVAEASHAQPNVVVVMTDDQTVDDMDVMSKTKSLIGERGTTFTNSFVNFPLCCPSRATFLTGQYAHNHGVRSGSGFGDLDSSNTLPIWLRDAGYTTGHVGKYVNGYGSPKEGGPDLVPSGWSEWYGIIPPDQQVYDYDLNENGALEHYGSAPSDFKGDVITGKAVDFIGRNAPSAAPFFLSVAYTAPHGAGQSSDPCANAAKPAPRHIGAAGGEPLPQPPSFNEDDVGDKHKAVRDLAKFGDSRVNALTKQHRCRLESLLHVDEGVAEIVSELRDADELEDTLIVFTSDNGFFQGQHRIPVGKIHVYDEASRVPLLMRGPGVPENATARGLASNADLAPTVLGLAGAAPGVPQDGKSLFDVIGAGDRSRELVIENHLSTEGRTPYAAVRTRRYSYIEYSTAERELFDHRGDPFQLDNRYPDPAYRNVVAWMERRLDELSDCQGAACRESAGEPPSPLVTASPTSAVIEPGGGSLAWGGAARLAANDDVFHQVNSTTSGTRVTSWYGAFSGVPNAIRDLQVDYSGRNTRPCGQTLSIWRWSDSSWVQIDPLSGSRSVGNTEVSLSDLAVGGEPGAYVSGSSGDGELRVRVRCTRTSDNYAAWGDFMQIEYEPVEAAPAYTPPQTTVVSGPDASTTSASASFTFSADEPTSKFECSLDGAAFSVCTSPRAYTGLGTGDHEFRVRATDSAGNTDPTPAHYVWSVLPSCTGGTVTARADADSWVLRDSSSSNYGDDSVLKVNTKAGADARALVRNALPSLPSGCQVTDAKLRLYAGSYKDGRTLEAVRLSEPWSEAAVTWNNQPGTSGTAAQATSRSGTVEWTVTPQVKNMYSGGNHGFLVRDSAEGGNGAEQGFHSREKGADNPPELVITYG